MSIKKISSKIRFTYFKIMDKLLTRLEKAVFDETYHDVDNRRIALEVENEALKNQISYLTERNEFYE